ncbi:MAG: hypothetical protein JO036_05335 [Candidatus Eremiobacteraeota bacterium]|nr:hypothetical protein [Candidatus Eremiobacteraeota bacterium]
MKSRDRVVLRLWRHGFKGNPQDALGELRPIGIVPPANEAQAVASFAGFDHQF